MKHYKLPKKQGLYSPSFEHDNCGIGFIANIDGKSTHNTIIDAITILKNLTHRGGVGNEKNTGDGAGILTNIPHKFMQKVCENEDIALPDAGEYGIGMFFCSHYKEIRENTINILKNIVEEEAQHTLGIRCVPTFSHCIGDTAKETMPYIMQIFIKRNESIKTELEFERKLFVILKRAEKEIRYIENGDPYFYMSSLSCKTIVYKGMLTPEQVDRFYIDLLDTEFKSPLALVHSRFSTNTFPSWERAHPNRYIIHNGEINTIRGNVNWLKAREKMFKTDSFSDEDLAKILPVINEDGSDSAMLDNYIQMLSLCGYSLPEAIMMAVPEPFENDENMDKAKRDFYAYNSLNTEAFDGPSAISFTNGDIIGTVLDRNGLRPARYCITKDKRVILSSETGVLPIDEEDIVKKGRVSPGKMLLVDIKNGKIITDNDIKSDIVNKNPYGEWLANNVIDINNINYDNAKNEEKSSLNLTTMQKAVGYYTEDISLNIKEIIQKGDDPIGAMGNDAPIAVFSKRPQLLYNYFKQLFAQVTNPPIDAIREQIITSTLCYLGSEGNLLNLGENKCKRIKLDTPILTDNELLKIKNIKENGLKSKTISTVYNKNDKSMETAIDDIYNIVDNEIKNGTNIIILSDKGITSENMPIPMLLISAGIHHHLIRAGNRTKVSIVIQSAEPREVHHYAVLLGYGANAINPYLTYETIKSMEDYKKDDIGVYINAITKGIVKVMSKMGISTLQSYMGAQIFEALGISENVVDKFFTNTTTRISGLDLEQIERESIERHELAFANDDELKAGGDYKWCKNGEYHMFNPDSIRFLQKAVRENDYSLYKKYSKLMDNHNDGLCTIRSMFDIRFRQKPINIDDVESVDNIVQRFKTGAMSYGSLSKEAHECIAIGMNRLKAKSNSGEGGELIERFSPMENGDSKCSAIKQVASGRFGVSINYLQNAVEIQIKMAQGAKPGEGGHLPGKKVYPWIAGARNSTTGVGLISPPPHHDIYSIEDLAQLIHDLKNANKDAKISVKLVSEAGVGTIAVGVCKSLADVILISGYDGGTGAAARTSIKHAGLPFELGLSETHQTLLLNNLRHKVVLETDGKMLTGKDVLIACLLGAEEFGFSTAPLVAIGCVMLRICHLNTCAVGVATQDPELRKRFKGKPEYIENLMRFIATELREYMAKLGFKKIDDMVGHIEKLKQKNVSHYKAKTVDLSSILYQPRANVPLEETRFSSPQDHKLEDSFDYNVLLNLCKKSIETGKKINAKFKINNTNRVCGTMLSSEIAKAKGDDGLLEDTINLTFEGSAGQSFGAFLSSGVTMKVIGDCNDYVGKGLSGGKIIVKKPKISGFLASENVIVGNVCLFGAIKGEIYINGIAGERFLVRNSGASAVVEGIGQHGLEYMTGGKALILGEVGRNFGAGMSGGVAYVYDEKDEFEKNCNKELILLEKLNDDDINIVKTMLNNHYKYTDSEKAKYFIDNFDKEISKFTKVIPKVYKEVTEKIDILVNDGYSKDDAMMKAFKEVSN